MDRMRLIEKLCEQLRFIERSATAYDKGAEDEAFRIAAALRIIFYDKGECRSLLSQLGLSDGKMLSSSRGRGDYGDYLDLRLKLDSSSPVRAIPRLRNPFREISVNQWWKHEPVFETGGVKYPRSKIVLSAANKDGGAHVDPKLEAYYEVLTSGKFTLGITGNLKFTSPPPYEQGVTHYAPNAHVALIRVFGHEALQSANYFKWGCASEYV